MLLFLSMRYFYVEGNFSQVSQTVHLITKTLQVQLPTVCFIPYSNIFQIQGGILKKKLLCFPYANISNFLGETEITLEVRGTDKKNPKQMLHLRNHRKRENSRSLQNFSSSFFSPFTSGCLKREDRDTKVSKSERGTRRIDDRSPPSIYIRIHLYFDIHRDRRSGRVHFDKMDLDQWIVKVKDGQHLSEDELQLLCEYVRFFHLKP